MKDAWADNKRNAEQLVLGGTLGNQRNGDGLCSRDTLSYDSMCGSRLRLFVSENSSVKALSLQFSYDRLLI